MDTAEWQDCQACVLGDHSACTRLLKQHEPEIGRQMWRFSRDRGVWEELVQEVMIEVYTSLPRYRPQETPLVHWIRRIATRVGYRYWKQQAKRRGQVPMETVDVASAGPEFGDPAKAAAVLHSLLAQLPVEDRLVLTLQYFEECSVEQIADRTGWNSAMVKMRAYRARGRLKKLIERHKNLNLLEEFAHGSARSD